MKIDDPTDYEYVLVQWPESQAFMDYEWFDHEASLADYNKFGSAAFFIPMKRWLESHADNSPQLPQDTWDGGQVEEK